MHVVPAVHGRNLRLRPRLKSRTGGIARRAWRGRRPEEVEGWARDDLPIYIKSAEAAFHFWVKPGKGGVARAHTDMKIMILGDPGKKRERENRENRIGLGFGKAYLLLS